jgi:hypothetical protein
MHLEGMYCPFLGPLSRPRKGAAGGTTTGAPTAPGGPLQTDIVRQYLQSGHLIVAVHITLRISQSVQQVCGCGTRPRVGVEVFLFLSQTEGLHPVTPSGIEGTWTPCLTHRLIPWGAFYSGVDTYFLSTGNPRFLRGTPY